MELITFCNSLSLDFLFILQLVPIKKTTLDFVLNIFSLFSAQQSETNLLKITRSKQPEEETNTLTDSSVSLPQSVMVVGILNPTYSTKTVQQ